MTVTDLITFVLSILLLLRGYSRGFINSLVGPVSVIVATIIGIIYYQKTKDLTIGLLIGLAGPFLLYFLLKSLLGIWAKATKADIQPNSFSRLTGATLTLIWGWAFIIFTLILLGILPPLGKTMTAVHNDVTRSMSYFIANPWKDILLGPIQNTAQVGSNNPSLDLNSLAQDPRFQKVLQDPEIQNEINAHDFAKLMSNPKMIELTKQMMNDPAAMKKVIAVYSRQAQPQTGLATSESSQ